MKRFWFLFREIIKSKPFIISVTVLVLLIIGFFIANKYWLNQDDKKPASPPTSSRFILTSDEVTKKLESAPISGPLQYKFISIYTAPDSKAPKFIYYSTEFDNTRLIEMNDKILKELKDQGKIKDDDTSYSISYFDDEQVAKTYFTKITDKKTTDNDKNSMRKSYTATYVFSKAFEFSYIMKISSAQIIKDYSA